MEELLDNVFVLVPVALLIFIRVFSGGAKKSAGRTTKPAAGSRQAASGATAGPGTLSGSTTLSDPGSGRGTKKTRPASRDLLGRLRDYLSGNLEKPQERLQPLHFEEEAARRLGQFRSQPAAAPATRTQTTTGFLAASDYNESLPGSMEESVAVPREPAARYNFPGRLESLPPLKRAIVLAEVLGKPKSLQ
ncbi:MAG: hypothetical protein AB7T74_05265 [Clostridia bacterium]